MVATSRTRGRGSSSSRIGSSSSGGGGGSCSGSGSGSAGGAARGSHCVCNCREKKKKNTRQNLRLYLRVVCLPFFSLFTSQVECLRMALQPYGWHSQVATGARTSLNPPYTVDVLRPYYMLHGDDMDVGWPTWG